LRHCNSCQKENKLLTAEDGSTGLTAGAEGKIIMRPNTVTVQFFVQAMLILPINKTVGGQIFKRFSGKGEKPGNKCWLPNVPLVRAHKNNRS
jgi:hypothetical protein